GVINALKFTGKDAKKCNVVVNGSGAAGIAITKLLLKYGFNDIILCDSKGIVARDDDSLNWAKKEMAQVTNKEVKHGKLADALVGADIFIGVSAPNIITEEMVKTMNKDSIFFAMANPVPEIMPDIAKKAGAAVVGTGRSDFPNQINNVMAFPGIFRGALDVRASDINEEMKLAAAYAIAGSIPDDEISADKVVPDALDPKVFENVSKAVAEAARKSGVARI
ncbi:MAG: NAD-dependent malic enzyme, partial [Lachnospiraceae bacterium]|nr:NAD-dependent malic enzyme [Lachnospiraceae bacterium]